MSLIVPNEGEIEMLKRVFNYSSADDCILHLYKDDVADPLVDTIEHADLTECDEAGYSPITLTGSAWSFSTSGGGTSTATYSEQSFTFTTAAEVYGYYVTNNADDQILFMERFSGAPFVLPGTGGTIAVTTKLSGD